MSEKEKLTKIVAEALGRGAKPGLIAETILEAGYTPPVSAIDPQRDPGDEDDSSAGVI